MDIFFSQVFNLLNSDTGALTYHLVLAFSIAAALQIVLLQAGVHGGVFARRMALGLGLLLILRLVLFGASALAWQGLIDSALLLPPLDRAVTVISLLVIVWLWAFPEARRMVDTAVLMVGLLTLTMIALGLVWWFEQAQGRPFNGSLLEFYAETVALVFLGLGAFLLLARRPQGWGTGLTMLVLLAAGHIAHLFLPPTGSAYPGAIRLAQLAAYPLLLALSQRVLVAPPPAAPAPKREPSTPRSDQKIAPVFLSLIAESDSRRLCPSLTAAVAYLMRCDLCLLVSLPAESPQLSIECAYNLITEHHMAGSAVDVRHVPFLVNALRHNKPVRMPASSTSPDQFGLARALDLPDGGHMLAAPLPLAEPDPVYAIVLLSPYSQRAWTTEDQFQLQEVLRTLAQFLQRSLKLDTAQRELDQLAQTLEDTRQELALAGQEKDAILDQLARVRQIADAERSQASSLAAAAAETEDVRQAMEGLQAENNYLRTMLTEWDDAHLKEVRTQAVSMDGELRLALEEIASLKETLAQAGEKGAGIEADLSGEGQALPDPAAVIALAHELRQPMSSLLGYTNMLLKEIDDPDLQHRKLLDRIRVAVERMNRIIDDLIQVSANEDDPQGLAYQRVDLTAVIDQAISETGDQLLEKQIALRVDLPESLPPLHADRQALQRVVLGLLRNAGAATPLMGEILLRGRVEGIEGEQRYILLQVADAGLGIPATVLPYIFSPIYRSENPVIHGLGDTSGELAETKALVESQGGRIWVDSRAGQGSTFSVVFPVSNNHRGMLPPGPDA